MINTVVFDMGNVLILFKPKLFIKRLNLSEEDSELLNNVVFKSSEWLCLDGGTMQETDVVSALSPRLPGRLHWALKKLVLEWDQPLIEIEGMEDVVRKLKDKGLNIYLLSNASTRQHEYWPRISAGKYFDGTLISADVKEMKPGSRIFELLFEKFGFKPEESIFVDDHEPNITAARQMGMNGIVFNGSADDLTKELEKLLGTSL